jgi:hypothetical protein
VRVRVIHKANQLGILVHDRFTINGVIDLKRDVDRRVLRGEVFFLNSPATLALFTGVNVPGFPADQKAGSRLISVQDIHTFSSITINEARIGYNFNF